MFVSFIIYLYFSFSYGCLDNLNWFLKSFGLYIFNGFRNGSNIPNFVCDIFQRKKLFNFYEYSFDQIVLFLLAWSGTLGFLYGINVYITKLFLSFPDFVLFHILHKSSLNDFGGNTYRELGIGIVPYSPLGRGFFGGKAILESIPADSFLVWILIICF